MKKRIAASVISSGVALGLASIPGTASAVTTPGYVAAGEVLMSGTDLCLSAPALRSGGGIGLSKCSGRPSQRWVLSRVQDIGQANPAQDLRFSLGVQLRGGQKAALFKGTAVLVFIPAQGKNHWRIALPAGLSLSGKPSGSPRSVIPAVWLRWRSEGWHQVWTLPGWKYVP